MSQTGPVTREVETLKSRGKAAIIQLAINMIKERKPDIIVDTSQYEITVWANNQKVLVKFRRWIRYVADRSYHFYDLEVNLINKRILPFDDFLYQNNFVVETPAQEQAIAYMKDLLGLPFKNMQNNVSEDEENYYADLTSKTAFAHIIISKATGKKTTLEGTYMVPPLETPLDSLPKTGDEDLLEEITK